MKFNSMVISTNSILLFDILNGHIIYNSKIERKINYFDLELDISFINFLIKSLRYKMNNSLYISDFKTECKIYNPERISIQEKIFNEIKEFIKENIYNNKMSSPIEIFTQSQGHGLFWENEIRTKVFQLEECKNDCNKYDINASENIFNNNENISIKTTAGNNVDCGDILRFYDYDFSKQNTIILIKFQQSGNHKKIKEILEINYNLEFRNILFGNITREKLEKYNNLVKSIEKGIVPNETKKEYLTAKKELQKTHRMLISISPKVDSKTQRRVQCFIRNIDKLLLEHPCFLISKMDKPIVRNIEIKDCINSTQRKRDKKNFKFLKSLE